MKLFRTSALTAAALALLAACESPAGSGSGSGSGPLRVSVTDGDNQQDTVMQSMPQQVWISVTDNGGKAVANQTVTWTVLTEGGGSAASATSTTNASGQASTTWTLGPRAGAHAMQVSAGEGSVADTVRAAALPGPAASTAVANNDTVFTLDPGQAKQLQLTAMDAHGNAVEAAAIAAAWTSRDTSTAAVAGTATATVTGRAAGRTVIDVAAPGGALRVRVTVRGLAQSLVALDGEVNGMHGGGNRMLASAITWQVGRFLWERTTGGWDKVAGVEAWERMVRVLPSGEGWMIGTGPGGWGLFRSPAAGAALTQVAAPVNPWVLTTGGSTVFMAAERSLAGQVYRYEGGSWTEIPLPAAGDTTIRLTHMAASAANDLLLGGGAAAGGVEVPYLARWNGTTTTRIAMPGAGIAWSQLSALIAGTDGAAYAMTWTPSGVQNHLIHISGTTATLLPNPLEQANLRISAIAVAPDGALWIGGEHMMARYAGGQWQSWTVRDSWSVLGGGMHVDASGHVWAGVMRFSHGDPGGTLRFEIIQ